MSEETPKSDATVTEECHVVKCEHCGKYHTSNASSYLKEVEADMTSESFKLTFERKLRLYE